MVVARTFVLRPAAALVHRTAWPNQRSHSPLGCGWCRTSACAQTEQQELDPAFSQKVFLAASGSIAPNWQPRPLRAADELPCGRSRRVRLLLLSAARRSHGARPKRELGQNNLQIKDGLSRTAAAGVDSCCGSSRGPARPPLHRSEGLSWIRQRRAQHQTAAGQLSAVPAAGRGRAAADAAACPVGRFFPEVWQCCVRMLCQLHVCGRCRGSPGSSRILAV